MVKNWWGRVVPPYQLLGVPVVPPYHLTKIFKLCKTSFYEMKVIVLMKEKLFAVSLAPNLNPLKIGQKLVGSCGPPLPTASGACGPLPLDQISCKTSFYELKVIVLMKDKLFPVSLTPNLNPLKIGQKLVGSCGPPLPTARSACGPPLPLDQNFKLCKTSFYELKVIVLMKDKLFPVSLTPNFNPLKIGQKLVGSCGPPLPTARSACGPPLPLDQNFETL